MALRAAITGTPGVGKTTVTGILEKQGYLVLDLNGFIHNNDLIIKKDMNRDTHIVDIERMVKMYDEAPEHDIVEGHLSHYLEMPITIVLRCDPMILKKRMKTKDWSVAKKEENLESEIMDVILIEASELDTEVYEIDTTHLSVEDVCRSVIDILKGDKKRYEPGQVDWSHYIDTRF